jgi:hypothetical protein
MQDIRHRAHGRFPESVTRAAPSQSVHEFQRIIFIPDALPLFYFIKRQQ